MDERRFDTITKSLGAPGSRRVALRTAIGITIATGLARLGVGRAMAKKKRRKHRRKWKKLKKNAFGCVNVGGACRGKDANCCSGLCEGLPKYGSKKDTSHCVAHNELNCAPGADTCQALALCGTNDSGVCVPTTGQASFCGDGAAVCNGCTKDVECEANQGPGAACIACPGCGTTFCLAAAV